MLIVVFFVFYVIEFFNYLVVREVVDFSCFNVFLLNIIIYVIGGIIVGLVGSVDQMIGYIVGFIGV